MKKQKEYEKCFAYQCLTHVCHGASIESKKFINVCCDCPAFHKWLKNRKI